MVVPKPLYLKKLSAVHKMIVVLPTYLKLTSYKK